MKNIDKTNITSKSLKEYFSFKEECEDAILLIQMGSFYEVYFEDAIEFSKVTGVQLTSKYTKDIGTFNSAGIPQNSLDTYIKKLLSQNYKIALAQQFQNENGEISRKITRIYTQGSIIEQEFLEAEENNYILSVYYKKDTFYLAYADISCGQFYKTKGDEKTIKHEIKKIQPNEILISKNQKEYFKDIISSQSQVTYLDEKYFIENAQGSIIKYCSENYKDITLDFGDIKEYSPSVYLFMDDVTRRNLELTRTKRYLKKKGSIFWFLNYTKTPMGTRLLKKYLSEPLVDISKIEKRNSIVSILVQDKKTLSKIESLLEKFCDLSRMCAKLINSTILPKNLLSLAHNADYVRSLFDITSDFFSQNEEKIKNIEEFSKLVKEAIKEDAKNDIKEGSILKEGYSPNLDYLRDKLSSIYQEFEEYTKKEQKRTGIEKLKYGYLKTIGWYLEVPKEMLLYTPEGYYKKQGLAHCTRFTNDDFSKLEQKIASTKFQIQELEEDLYNKLKKQALNFIETIRVLSDDIAIIDVYSALAHCALVNKLQKPEYSKEGIFVKRGFHPSLLKLKNELTKNDTELKNNSGLIITGANMSGKSTYLKQNAILCLLFQIGSFVPADSAKFTIIDKMFIRQETTDDIINNNSSFMVEMNDLKFILDNATEHSLILLDEPAKSTSSNEGGAIARAFLEYVILHLKSKFIAATHNLELTKLEKQYPKYVTDLVIDGIFDNKTNSSRLLKRGIMNSSYAINTAISADLPEEIITKARNYINQQN